MFCFPLAARISRHCTSGSRIDPSPELRVKIASSSSYAATERGHVESLPFSDIFVA